MKFHPIVAVALVAVMATLVLAFKKRVDAEADGSAYQAHEPTLGDRIFGGPNGVPVASRGGSASASADAESETETDAEASESEAEAETETDAATEAETEAEAETGEASEAEAETDAEFRAEFEDLIADADRADARDAAGLTRALGAEGEREPATQGEEVERSIELDAPIARVWSLLEGEPGQVVVVPQRVRKNEGPKHTLWQVYAPLDGGRRTKLTLRARPTGEGAAMSSAERGAQLEQVLARIQAAVEGEARVATRG